LGHWVPPWEKLPYNNPTRNPLARSYSFVKTAKLLTQLQKPSIYDLELTKKVANHVVGGFDKNFFAVMITFCGAIIQLFN